MRLHMNSVLFRSKHRSHRWHWALLCLFQSGYICNSAHNFKLWYLSNQMNLFQNDSCFHRWLVLNLATPDQNWIHASMKSVNESFLSTNQNHYVWSVSYFVARDEQLVYSFVSSIYRVNINRYLLCLVVHDKLNHLKKKLFHSMDYFLCTH
jgi:hypothetical protein